MPLQRLRSLAVCAFLLLQAGCAGVPFGKGEEERAPVREAPSTQAADPSRAGTIESGQDFAPSRDLPESRFPEIDASSLPAAGHHKVRKAEAAAAELAASQDLWLRLNAGFQLGNLEALPGRVEKFERWYARHPKYFERLGDRSQWYMYYVLGEVERRGMPTEVALLPAIESAFRPDATSRSGAAGLWQFIPATGRRFGLRQDWWMDARRDLPQSTRAALDYLEYLNQEFDGDWELAFAAYNAGEGTIQRAMRQNRSRDLPTSYAHLKLRNETLEYVPRLLAVRNILRNPAKYGITLPPVDNLPSVQVVDLRNQTDISVAASFSSLTNKQLHYLNLGYKRGITPPNGPHTLVVPVDEADTLVAKLDSLSPTQRMRWAHHQVRKGDNLGKIARMHGVSVQSIQRANSLNSNLIRPGQELRIPLSSGAYQYAGPATESSTAQRKHLVAKGDSLWKISRSYGIQLNDLLSWNQLSRNTTLYPGQSVIVRP